MLSSGALKNILKRGGWIALAALAVAGLFRLRFDVDVLNLLPPDEPAVRGIHLYQSHFANSRELIVTVRGTGAAQTAGFAQTLAERLRQDTNLVAAAAWREPWKEHPEQLAELLAFLLYNQPPQAFGALARRLDPGSRETVVADAKEALATSLSPEEIGRRAYDPFGFSDLPELAGLTGMAEGEKSFASPDGTFRIVFVQARAELSGYQECARWLAQIRAVADDLRKSSPEWAGLTVQCTGSPAFVAEIAAGMRRDICGSVTGTALIIAALFWLAHRRWLPMLWLLALLALILAGTLALGGLILGKISVVSMGFAAVLLGLAVDYAVVHYQEALSHPQLTVPEIRRAISPSILWAAITTICAFLSLNFGGLPGLGQLGSLVGIGVALAALVMVMIYLPPLFPERRQPPPGGMGGRLLDYLIPPRQSFDAAKTAAKPGSAGLVATALIALAAVAILCIKPPRLDRSAAALQPARGEAQAALDDVTALMGIPQDALWVFVTGRDESEVAQRLDQLGPVLSNSVSQGLARGYVLAAPLWPRPDCQQSNRAAALQLVAQGPALRQCALDAGFNTNALLLTDELLKDWASYARSDGPVWPTNETSRFLLKQFTAHSTNSFLVMGLVYPATNRLGAVSGLSALFANKFGSEGILLSGWDLLGGSTLARVRERMWLMVAPMVLLVLASLWLAFRNPVEILLGLGVLLLGGLCAQTVMVLAGWSWNLLSLMAVPLMLGTGVDYGIFVQLALRRHGGDAAAVRRSVGRALLLCGSTAVAGFGSLGFSGNAGMASLGRVCAAGIAANMLIAVYLLPAWWQWARMRPEPDARAPSRFYRAWLWRLGLRMARVLPGFALRGIGFAGAELCWWFYGSRRRIAIANLLPVANGDPVQARWLARRLFRQFGLKLMDLWRFESGVPVESWITSGTDWGALETACKRGKGVLLVTPHLGNWELGGPLLKERLGAPLVVLTQAEPGSGLTELRKASRARWGIETLVIGEGGFEFVEVIRRLQEGAIVALLIDRPPDKKAVEVELFNRPFRASVAAAELVRASGCALIGAAVLRHPNGLEAKIFAEFAYDRQALGQPGARRELTQSILRAFEPEIRRCADQWFHFVPVWNPPSPGPGIPNAVRDIRRWK